MSKIFMNEIFHLFRPSLQTAGRRFHQMFSSLWIIMNKIFMNEIFRLFRPSLQTAGQQGARGVGLARRDSVTGTIKIKSLEETVFDIFKNAESKVHVGKFLNVSWIYDILLKFESVIFCWKEYGKRN